VKRNYLGEFEEVVLLITSQLQNNAYGVSITEAIQEQTGRRVTISAVHATLTRLENKGIVKSHLGGATTERGGRRKRFFAITTYGSRILHEVWETRQLLWQRIPQGALKWEPK
jgi:DNA-binding PadR family transcriptional regulator